MIIVFSKRSVYLQDGSWSSKLLGLSFSVVTGVLSNVSLAGRFCCKNYGHCVKFV
jgi:hypothetical protein